MNARTAKLLRKHARTMAWIGVGWSFDPKRIWNLTPRNLRGTFRKQLERELSDINEG